MESGLNAHRDRVPRTTLDYYHQVASYYDEEADVFEQHYRNNPVLQRLRNDFRLVSESYPFQSALEIGCGPGIDLDYFARKYPHRQFYGIDVSPAMVAQARAKLARLSRQNAVAEVGTPESIVDLFDGRRFDLIYCYFGALNTVPDLKQTAMLLSQALSEQGTMVLTFVNRWYWFDIVWNMLRLRWRRAWARPLNLWRGYAPNRPLTSDCRSAREIKRAFKPVAKLQRRKGYSILFPAWYRQAFIPTRGMLGKVLWRLDQLMNHTLFWNLGEYSLYVFKRR
ncbi:class I SAM-dependent methyltransferase [candidate division KSB1 bacterium]|nr:class I SAM-dependent methyltransferase [candidate division KSB1 bacterium]